MALALMALGACTSAPATGEGVLVEAENFAVKGGWSVDQQFTFEMGSPYLIAHGMGRPVGDASTEVTIPAAGQYHVYVRTYNWTSPWSDKSGPGAFTISVGGSDLDATLGCGRSAERHGQDHPARQDGLRRPLRCRLDHPRQKCRPARGRRGSGRVPRQGQPPQDPQGGV